MITIGNRLCNRSCNRNRVQIITDEYKFLCYVLHLLHSQYLVTHHYCEWLTSVSIIATYSDCAHIHGLFDDIKVIDETERLDIDRLVEGPGILQVPLGAELLEQLVAILELVGVGDSRERFDRSG